MRYREAADLPLNDRALGGAFVPWLPGNPEPDTADPGHTGHRILVAGGGLVVQGPPDAPSPLIDPPAGLVRQTPDLLLGSWHGRPVRVGALDDRDRLPDGLRVEPFLALLLTERLPDDLATLADRAVQALHWERSGRLCQRCGGRTVAIPRTRGRRCDACPAEQFPQVHPCAIVLVRRGEELLLIHKNEWPDSLYSLPSGFSDAGECLEDCARREVREETGVEIDNLHYEGSQFWPFPSQVMVAFTADYAGGRLAADEDEVATAAWFRRDALPVTPTPMVIAGWLIDAHRR